MALIVWFSNKLIFNEIVFFIYALRIYDIPDRTTISIVPTFTTNTYTGLKHAMEVSKSSIIRENVSITNNIIWNKTLQKVWGEWNLHRRKLRYFLLTGTLAYWVHTGDLLYPGVLSTYRGPIIPWRTDVMAYFGWCNSVMNSICVMRNGPFFWRNSVLG